MSTGTVTKPSAAPKGGGRRKLTLPWIMLIVAAGLLLFSLVRAVSGANDLTSVGQVSGALQLAVPIGLPVSAVCGPSARASSTSASKA
jgi:simple sugar transport system permease protein